MRIRYALAVAVAVAVALAALATPAAAHAGARFYADSGDACRYGSAQGALTWGLAGVTAEGSATDRPVPNDPVFCRDDTYDSTVLFTAYADTSPVEQKVVDVDNATVPVSLTLGSKASAGRVNRLVVQVCRGPVKTTAPTYCGKPVEYHR